MYIKSDSKGARQQRRNSKERFAPLSPLIYFKIYMSEVSFLLTGFFSRFLFFFEKNLWSLTHSKYINCYQSVSDSCVENWDSSLFTPQAQLSRDFFPSRSMSHAAIAVAEGVNILIHPFNDGALSSLHISWVDVALLQGTMSTIWRRECALTVGVKNLCDENSSFMESYFPISKGISLSFASIISVIIWISPSLSPSCFLL